MIHFKTFLHLCINTLCKIVLHCTVNILGRAWWTRRNRTESSESQIEDHYSILWRPDRLFYSVILVYVSILYTSPLHILIKTEDWTDMHPTFEETTVCIKHVKLKFLWTSSGWALTTWKILCGDRNNWLNSEFVMCAKIMEEF